ncbi:MAG: TolC family protein [Bacteroidia bacterium]
MKVRTIYNLITAVLVSSFLGACVPVLKNIRTENKNVPASYNNLQDSNNIADINWKAYFNDQNLVALIDTALKNNQELNITFQEIEISKNEIRARKGEYLPTIGLRGGASLDKVGQYTRNGAVEKNLQIKEGTPFPEPFTDYMIGAYASWELDVWRKLRNAKKSATMRYLSSVEGRNFMMTNMISEISSSYYELMALDNQLELVRKNIEIQSNALHTIKQQKEAAKVTQLAVNRFEAQLLNTQNLQYNIQQNITETENRINYLLGRFPQPIGRSPLVFNNISPDSLFTGVPSDLLKKRPDIRKAELDLAAAKLDVKVAKANFYPSISITAGAGFQAFNPAYLISPESILYSLGGDLVAPLINRNAIKSTYYNANAGQAQAVYNYERTILNAYIEVHNQLSKINNLQNSFQTKSREADMLTQSIQISGSLFTSARADYMEVLLTQRESLESRMELIEIKTEQLKAKVFLYKALGGGWR